MYKIILTNKAQYEHGLHYPCYVPKYPTHKLYKEEIDLITMPERYTIMLCPLVL